MIQDFVLSETTISFYLILNWVCCFISTIWLCFIYQRKRFLFIKPSFLLIAYTYLIFQWPMTIYSGYYEHYLPDPWTFALIIHVFVFAGCLISMITFNCEAKEIWNRITEHDFMESAVNLAAIRILLVIMVVITIMYLSYYSLSKTGLYAIFMDPQMAGMAREESLKLLENRALVYAYSLMTSSVAPILIVMSYLMFVISCKSARYKSCLWSFLIIFSVIVVVSLTGSRAPAVNMLLAMVVAGFFRRGIQFKPITVVIIVMIVLLPAALLSMLREGRTLEIGLLPEYFGFIAGRVLVIPLAVGSWYVHFAQTNCLFGLSGIPKLAYLFGEPAINVPNFIAYQYYPWATETMSAPAGYIFSYYSYFGIASLVISLIGLCLLDIALLVYRRLSNYILLPAISAIAVSTVSFLSTDYLTVWLTHGFGVILLLSLMLDRVIKHKNKISNHLIEKKQYHHS